MSTPLPAQTPDRKPDGVSWLAYAKKAFIAAGAGAVAVLGVLMVAVTNGSDGGTSITAAEWIQAAAVGIPAAFGAAGVFLAKNVTTLRDSGWNGT